MSLSESADSGQQRQPATDDERSAVVGVLQQALDSLEELQAQRELGESVESGWCESAGTMADRPDDSYADDAMGDGGGLSAPAGALKDDPEYKRAKKRAMNMLAARDHGSAELREKLLKKEHPPYAVDALIAGLERSNLLDDEAFAHSFVRAKRQGRALSKQALRRELTKKGISADDAAPALEEVDDEYEVALSVAVKKAAGTTRLPSETRKRRILGMLARRGYPSGICMRAADAALEQHPADDETSSA